MNKTASSLASLERLVPWLAARGLERRTIRELDSLDDRMLADIGIERDEIASVVRHTSRKTAPVSAGFRTCRQVLLSPLGAVLSLAALLTVGISWAVPAQIEPAKPIRLIVPFAPGGPNDISARIIADELMRSLQQTVIVANLPGAGGNLAAEAAAKARADGSTLFWAQAATHGINPALYRKRGYDALRDFAPVGLVVSEPLVLVTGAASPFHDLTRVIVEAKADPATIHFGSGGIGTTPHMAGELFAVMAGARLMHVPYRSNAPAVSDTIAGRIQLVFDNMNASLGHIRAGTLKALAVTSRERVAALPDVPALAETLPEYEVTSWGGIVAPAATPADVTGRLSNALMAIGKEPAVQQRFAALGAQLDVSTPTAMDAFVRTQIERWRTVVDKNGLGMD
jgi:tripartite-type tricarboxylate transporter receptor subunit TctC/uncharacterized protein YjiS (DUF1127 family)